MTKTVDSDIIPGSNPRKGHPKAGGRRKGVKNKVTRELGDFARIFTKEAMAVLYDLMWTAQNEAVRKAAATEILDRGHGRATQSVSFPQLTTEQIMRMSLEDLRKTMATLDKGG